MKTLADFINEISEEFQSTFTAVDEHTLANMMGKAGDFTDLTKIIQKYLPDAEVWFHKSGEFAKSDYDIYFIRAVL